MQQKTHLKTLGSAGKLTLRANAGRALVGSGLAHQHSGSNASDVRASSRVAWVERVAVSSAVAGAYSTAVARGSKHRRAQEAKLLDLSVATEVVLCSIRPLVTRPGDRNNKRGISVGKELLSKVQDPSLGSPEEAGTLQPSQQ